MEPRFKLTEEWPDDPSWQPYIERATSPNAAQSGLAALADIFTPEWACRRPKDSPWPPFAVDLALIGWRYQLVEMGVAINRFRPNRIRDRLRNDSEYRETQAELYAALALESLGAELQHEPAGRRASGPDWLASWPAGGSVSVEVKCPGESHKVRGRSTAAVYIMFALMRQLARFQKEWLGSETWFTVAPDPPVVEKIANAGTLAQVRAEELVHVAVADLQTMAWPLADGEYPLAAVGCFRLRRGHSPEARFQFQAEAIVADEPYEDRRVFDVLQEAATQLAAIPEQAGLVVIDTVKNRWPMRSLDAVVQAIETKVWARNFAGVLVLYPTFGEDGWDCIIGFAPGQRSGWLYDILCDRLHRCPEGHYHLPGNVYPRTGCHGFP